MNLSRLALVSAVIILLVSCTSAPKRSTSASVITSESQIPQDVLSSDYYLQQAAQDYSSNGDMQQRNQWLLNAAEALQQEKKCAKSIKLLRVIQAELNTVQEQTQSQLLMAECYLQLAPPAIHQAQQLVVKIPTQLGFRR